MRRPSPAMLVACAALFVALGGTSLAATGLINGAQIRNHTISAAKLTPAAVTALHGQRGPAGPAGTNGTFDPSKLQVVQGDPISVSPGQSGFAVVACPSGSYNVGGGGYASIGRMTLSGPTENGQQGWTISVLNDTNVGISGVRAYVICAS